MQQKSNFQFPNSFQDWKTVPLTLKVLLLFGISALSYMIIDKFLGEDSPSILLIPHFGWIGIQFYLFPLIAVVFLIGTRSEGSRQALQFFFIVQMLFGIYGLWMFSDNMGHENPYIRYTLFRPLWEIVVPAVWIFLLSKPNIKNFCLPHN